MTAIGMIETKGLLAAVECADAMLKAADVRLLEKNLAGAGLVTITIAGEVSAVKASVEAGVAAARRISGAVIVSDHVIARPDFELENVIAIKPEQIKYEVKGTEEPASGKSEEKDEKPAIEISEFEETGTAAHEPEDVKESLNKEALKSESQVKPEASRIPPKSGSLRHGVSQLKKMNVGRLRQIAKGFKDFSIDEKQIETARKKELIEAIVNAYRQEEEE